MIILLQSMFKWSRDKSITPGVLLPQKPLAELKKDGPLLEIMTELLNFSFFLNNYSRYKELERLYKQTEEGDETLSLFNHEYFSGTVLLLALFDLDSHWQLASGANQWTNKQIPLINQFCELIDEENPHFYGCATPKQLRLKFHALYQAIGNTIGKDNLVSEACINNAVETFIDLLSKTENTDFYSEINSRLIGPCLKHPNPYQLYALLIVQSALEFIDPFNRNIFFEHFSDNREKYLNVKHFYNIETRANRNRFAYMAEKVRKMAERGNIESHWRMKTLSSLEMALDEYEKSLDKYSYLWIRDFVKDALGRLQYTEKDIGPIPLIESLRKRLDNLEKKRSDMGREDSEHFIDAKWGPSKEELKARDRKVWPPHDILC